jgi:glycosyltransferase involved in cell wall biosynthesis
MRIAMVDPSLFTLPYDSALAEGLEAEGHQVVLHGRAPGPDDNDAGRVRLDPSFYRLAGSRVAARLPRALRLGLKGVDHAWSMRRLLARLRRERPDVIHFQWLPLPLVDRRFLAGFRAVAPLVLTVHDTDPFNGDPAAGVQRLGARRALDGFDRLIVHTEQGRARMVADAALRDRVALLPHGLLNQPGGALAEDPMTGPLTILLFGKVKPYKGADVLIEAVARMPPAARAQCRVRIVGKPYMDLAPLEALARTRGVADCVAFDPRFTADDEIPALFGPGVVAVFPYREIEASGVLSLAIAHGRPIVASRLGGFAEAIEDGVHGSLVPPGDAAALAAALTRLVEDRGFAAACAARVRALAGQVPGWREIARQTVAVYAEGAARRERG